jgi:uncharacterized phage protein (TIGR02218 family)
MAFATYEESTESGQPIQLYRFTLGTTVWRYTSSDSDLQLGGVLWLSEPISDDGVKQTGESVSDTMNINCPDHIGPAVVFSTSPPNLDIQVEILRLHAGETVAQVVYVGDLIQVNFPRPGNAVLLAQSLSATMRRMGLRLAYQRSCPHVLYDPLTCKAAKAANAYTGTITFVEGFTIEVSAFSGVAAGTLRGGFIEWVQPGQGTRTLTIEQHNGADLVMFDDTVDLYPGLAITAYRGCQRTTDACRTFNNIENYGGFPYMPGKSPFDGLNSPFF